MKSDDASAAIEAMELDPDRLRADPDFMRWRDSHRRIEVDGRAAYLRWGDHLADEDQLLIEWLQATGRIDRSASPPTGAEFMDIEGEPE